MRNLREKIRGLCKAHKVSQGFSRELERILDDNEEELL